MPDLMEAGEFLESRESKIYAEAQAAQQRMEELKAWLWLHESTVVEALKLCVSRLPNHLVSRFERALDTFPKERK